MEPTPITTQAQRGRESTAALFSRILVPVDFTDASRASLAAACEAARRLGSVVVLFHVANAGENDGFLAGTGAAWSLPDVIAVGRELLRAFAEEEQPDLAPSFVYDVVGSIALERAVSLAATRHDATLVVLAAPNEGVFRTRSERIARELACPVLLVHGTIPPPAQ
jgi:nucleotide-binding universal stress UspA family protein